MLVMQRLSKEEEEQLDAVLRRRSAGLLAAGVSKLSKVIARNLKPREVP